MLGRISQTEFRGKKLREVRDQNNLCEDKNCRPIIQALQWRALLVGDARKISNM